MLDHGWGVGLDLLELSGGSLKQPKAERGGLGARTLKHATGDSAFAAKHASEHPGLNKAIRLPHNRAEVVTVQLSKVVVGLVRYLAGQRARRGVPPARPSALRARTGAACSLRHRGPTPRNARASLLMGRIELVGSAGIHSRDRLIEPDAKSAKGLSGTLDASCPALQGLTDD